MIESVIRATAQTWAVPASAVLDGMATQEPAGRRAAPAFLGSTGKLRNGPKPVPVAVQQALARHPAGPDRGVVAVCGTCGDQVVVAERLLRALSQRGKLPTCANCRNERLDGAVYRVSLYPEAGEATYAKVRERKVGVSDIEDRGHGDTARACFARFRKARVSPAWQPEAVEEVGFVECRRRAREGGFRARRELRRYVKANRLRYLWTLTFERDVRTWAALCRHLERFVDLFGREMYSHYGPVAWVLVVEPHPDGHGWHVHLATSRRLSIYRMFSCWRYPRVRERDAAGRWVWSEPKALGMIHVGDPDNPETRLGGWRPSASQLASYLGKYLTKTFDVEGEDYLVEPPPAGSHRYRVAEGFKPHVEVLEAPTWDRVGGVVCGFMGQDAVIVREWRSSDLAVWSGPPCGWIAVNAEVAWPAPKHKQSARKES